MDLKKRRLVMEGNSLYEIDLECMNKKRGSGCKNCYPPNRNMYSVSNEQLNKKKPGN